MSAPNRVQRVAIACGGTGGHLFPGLAVARELRDRGVEALLMVSPKAVDQHAVAGLGGEFRVMTVPAVGFTGANLPAFFLAGLRACRASRRGFQDWRPDAVLAMGGFTSVAPVLAGRRLGCPCFLHESNAVAGRATRWLSRMVEAVFVGFPAAAGRIRARRVVVTGTPVRPEFRKPSPEAARATLGLDPDRPLVLIMGGSQGARAVNDWVSAAAPSIARTDPRLQWCHLTGAADESRVREVYAASGLRARVLSFCSRMADLMAASTLAVSRSGASSLAELAAVRLPAVLVPYPDAADDHQRANARVFVEAGAAAVLDPAVAGVPEVVEVLGRLLSDPEARARIQAALAGLDAPGAAVRIAEAILGHPGSVMAAGRTAPNGGHPRPGIQPKVA